MFRYRYGYFDHDADVGIIGRGVTLEEAYEAAAAATFALMTELPSVRCARTINVSFEEADLELALVRWLNVLLAAAREHGLVFSLFALERDHVVWRGAASGESWRSGMERGTEVKGATLTMLSVKQTPEGWEARCVVDVWARATNLTRVSLGGRMDLARLRQSDGDSWSVPLVAGEQRAEVRIYGSAPLLATIDDKVLEQITNVARLPGSSAACLTMRATPADRGAGLCVLRSDSPGQRASSTYARRQCAVRDVLGCKRARRIGCGRCNERSNIVLRRRRLRRTVGALFVVVGGLLMWFAPASTFVPLSAVGIALLAAGIVLEALGIALERRDPTRQRRGKQR